MQNTRILLSVFFLSSNLSHSLSHPHALPFFFCLFLSLASLSFFPTLSLSLSLPFFVYLSSHFLSLSIKLLIFPPSLSLFFMSLFMLILSLSPSPSLPLPRSAEHT